MTRLKSLPNLTSQQALGIGDQFGEDVELSLHVLLHLDRHQQLLVRLVLSGELHQLDQLILSGLQPLQRGLLLVYERLSARSEW